MKRAFLWTASIRERRSIAWSRHGAKTPIGAADVSCSSTRAGCGKPLVAVTIEKYFRSVQEASWRSKFAPQPTPRTGRHERLSPARMRHCNASIEATVAVLHRQIRQCILWLNKMYLLMEKQHNRGQDGAGLGQHQVRRPSGQALHLPHALRRLTAHPRRLQPHHAPF